MGQPDVRDGITCPTCARDTVTCTYVDGGYADQLIDEFTHKCQAVGCTHRETRTTCEGSSDTVGSPHALCPFCGRRVSFR